VEESVQMEAAAAAAASSSSATGNVNSVGTSVGQCMIYILIYLSRMMYI
jgi:hypothetical protein